MSNHLLFYFICDAQLCLEKIVNFAKFAKRIDETTTRNRDRKNEAVAWQHFQW
jgi:hypothetical protein